MKGWTGAAIAEKQSKAPRAPASDAHVKAEKPAAPTAKILAARREVIHPARLAYENTTFGVTLYCRKYQVLDPDHAAALDALFEHLTNPKP